MYQNEDNMCVSKFQKQTCNLSRIHWHILKYNTIKCMDMHISILISPNTCL